MYHFISTNSRRPVDDTSRAISAAIPIGASEMMKPVIFIITSETPSTNETSVRFFSPSMASKNAPKNRAKMITPKRSNCAAA